MSNRPVGFGRAADGRTGRRHHRRESARRLLPVGDLRAPVLRDDDQLHRSPGDRHPQADASAAARLDRGRLRRHRLCLSARLRGRAAARRPDDGSPRDQARLRGRDHRLEHCRRSHTPRSRSTDPPRPPCLAGVGLTLLGLGRRVHRGAAGARTRRGGELPGRDQGGRRVVSQAGTRAGDRHLQLRHQRRRAGHADRGALDHLQLRLVLGVHRHGHPGLLLAVPVVADLQLAREAPRGCRQRRWPTSAAIRPEKSTPVPLSAVLPHRQTWAFAVGKFMTDPVWWLYLFWMPDFFSRNYGLDLKGIGLPLVVIYQVASVGSIGGGWLSSSLLGAVGGRTPRARPRCSSARWRSSRSCLRRERRACGRPSR